MRRNSRIYLPFLLWPAAFGLSPGVSDSGPLRVATAWTLLLPAAALAQDDPEAEDDRATTSENTSVVIDVLANDSGEGIRVTSVDQPENGSVTTNENGTLTYTPNPGFTGEDEFDYTITDANNEEDEAEVEVTVTPAPNQPPEATIDSPSQSLTVIQAGESVSFTGSATDPDGVIVSYSWNFGGGAPNQSVEDPGQVQFNTPGTFTVVFNVSDDDGASDSTPPTRQVQVVAAPPPTNQPPNATIDRPAQSLTVIEVGRRVDFRGSASDPDGTIVSYSWDFGGGAPNESVEDPGQVQFNTPGTFTVVFNVRDDDGAVDPTPPSRQVQVVAGPPPANQPPSATIDTPAQSLVVIPVGQSVNFTGSANDPDGTIVAYRWTFGGGAPDRTVEDPGQVTFGTPGLFTVVFNVTDDDGAVDPTPPSRQIQVVQPPPPGNQPPNAVIDAPAGNVVIQAGQSVAFQGTGTDPDGAVVAFAWTFSGGTPASSNLEDPGQVTFSVPGNYTVTFNVSDDDGAVDPTPDARTITVTSPGGANQPPEALIVMPSGNLTIPAGESVTFAGRATDPDGTVVGYLWNFGGGAANATQQNPGAVRFARPGVYTVTFNATDDDGAADPTPDRRVVTVTQVSPTNAPPSAAIDQPAEASVTVPVGGSVTFAGTGTDTDGRVVAFLWNFGGGAPNLSAEDPGPVAFTAEGTYVVTFNVTDDQGASDPTPPTVTVVVGGGGPGGGNVAELNVETGQPGSEARVDGHDVIFVLRAVITGDARGDVNGDGMVNGMDIQLTLAALGRVE